MQPGRGDSGVNASLPPTAFFTVAAAGSCNFELISVSYALATSSASVVAGGGGGSTGSGVGLLMARARWSRTPVLLLRVPRALAELALALLVTVSLLPCFKSAPASPDSPPTLANATLLFRGPVGALPCP